MAKAIKYKAVQYSRISWAQHNLVAMSKKPAAIKKGPYRNAEGPLVAGTLVIQLLFLGLTTRNGNCRNLGMCGIETGCPYWL